MGLGDTLIITHSSEATELDKIDNLDWSANHTISGNFPYTLVDIGTGIPVSDIDGYIAPPVLNPSSGTLRVPLLIEEKLGIVDQASVTFSDLDGDVDTEYFIESMLSLSTADKYVFAYPNGLTTNQNGAAHLARSAAQAAIASPGFLVANSSYAVTASLCYGETKIYAKSGQKRSSLTNNGTSGSNYQTVLKAFGVWTDTTTNITSLVVTPTAGTISGWIRLYKMVDLVIS